MVDDRDEQPPVGVHRDAQVLGVVVGDRPLLDVDAGVEVRVLPQRCADGDREERQEGELDAFPCLERGLRAVPQTGHAGDVGFDNRGELGTDL